MEIEPINAITQKKVRQSHVMNVVCSAGLLNVLSAVTK